MSFLDEIKAGKILRKVPESEINDRSTLDKVLKPRVSPSAAEIPGSQTSSVGPRPNAKAASAALNTIFAGGSPKGRPTVGHGTGTSSPAPQASPVPSQPSSPRTVAPPSASMTSTASQRPPPPPPPPSSLASSLSSSIQHSSSYPRPSGPTPLLPKPAINGGLGLGRVPTTCAVVANNQSRTSDADSISGMLSCNSSYSTTPRVSSGAFSPPPPPPPPARRKSSVSNRSQRTGLATNARGVLVERSINAKPKVIHVNSQDPRSSPVPGPSPASRFPPPSAVTSLHRDGRVHPPPPPPPVPPSTSTLSTGVATLSAEFERRFRFPDESQFPPPPEPYRGPRTYRAGHTGSR
ncbi:unnamed protein product [Dicrocoelium dendriticum]|nr:unnamed protein product [Dicrocoelium dendriticum]